MTVSIRMNENRTLAAQYRGEALRFLHQLTNLMELGEIDTAGRSRTYPDGTMIQVRRSFGNAIVEITSPWPKAEKHEEKPLYRDVLIFFEEDGKKKIAIAHVSALGVDEGEAPAPDIFDAADFDVTFGSATFKTVVKEFTYQGRKILFVRMPFTFSGSTSVGHYFFEGCTGTGAYYRDYIYVPETAKFFYLQEGAGIDEPFNVGDYIYASRYMQMRAWSFDFDTETVSLEKDFNSGNLYLKTVDSEGNFYYPGSSDALTLYDSYQIPNQGILHNAPYNVTRNTSLGLANSPWEMFDYVVGIQNSMTNFASVGHWPGGVITPFVTEISGPHLLHEQRGVVITLHKIRKINLWTEADSVHLDYAWSHTTHDLEGTTCLLSLNYEDHLDCFGKLDGVNIVCAPQTFESELTCGTPDYTHSSGGGQANAHGEWASSEKKTVLGKAHSSQLSFSGDSADTWDESEHTGHSLDISVSARQVDYTVNLIRMPLGSSPFHVRRVRTQIATLLQSENDVNVAGLDQTYSLSDNTASKFVSPYEEVSIDNEETVAGWMHLEAREVLAQGVIASNVGQIAYGSGSRIETDLADLLGVSLTQIYGILYLPEVTEIDPEFAEKSAEA